MGGASERERDIFFKCFNDLPLHREGNELLKFFKNEKPCPGFRLWCLIACLARSTASNRHRLLRALEAGQQRECDDGR